MTLPLLRRTFVAAAAALLTAGMAPDAHAQIGGLGGALGRAAHHVNLGSLTSGPQPISTSLGDARWAVDSLDSFTPREAKRSLMTLRRTPNGGFVLQPGYYELHDQSYCLHAGTHGPGGGDGYIFAPPKGTAEDAVMSVVRNSVQHPNIDQHDVQLLLWAIVARAKFEDLDTRLQQVASQLLTPRQLATLNRSALDLVPGAALNSAMDRVPPLVRQVLQSEAQLRQMLTTPGTPYEQMERVAVLAGVPALGAGSRAVPSGRWSLHPDGYYIRYLPYSYTNTVVQVWVPQGSPAVGREYDPATHIAVPGNTARQRLIQSGRPYNQS
ncbi:MAG: hypothetical protein JWM27_4502 [Gemmatimonadetes bacterium]|nr:hypothetical protein [Gemmatimonadota bacterium]